MLMDLFGMNKQKRSSFGRFCFIQSSPRFCKIVNDKLIPGRSAGLFAIYLYL